MLCVNRENENFHVVLVEFLRDGVCDELTELAPELHGVALHEGFGEFIEVVVLSFRWGGFL